MQTEIKDERQGWTSASSAAMDKRCPGRFLAQKNLPEVKTDAAEHGRAIHEALKKQDATGLDFGQEEIYQACRTIEAKVVAQFFSIDQATAEASKPFREQRYWIHWKDDLQHSGQIDSAHKVKTRALIVEYKTLAGDVPGSPENAQLRDQVCLFDHNYAGLLTEIGTVVIQPLVTHSPKITIYKREHMAQVMKAMHERVAASNNPNSPRVPGEVQCKFCKAASAGVCKEYNQWAASSVMANTSLVDVPVSEWTPAQCVIFLDKMGVAQKWLDNCKEAMKARIKADPNAIPGWKLEDGDERQTIINAQSVFERFSEIGGSLAQFMDCIGIGKGDLKKSIAGITKARGKTLEKELEAVIGKDFTAKVCEPSLARKKE
jgi:Protein of unknown function (DUF2800)